MGKWDLVIMLLLIYTALFTPYEVAFLDLSMADGLFWVSFCVDLLFLKDIILHFFLAFDDAHDSTLVISLHDIGLHYLKGWFFLDLISIFPFTIIGESLKSEALEDLDFVRILRLLRLAKLLRISKGLRVLSRWERKLNISYAQMTSIRLLVIAFFFVHWIACAWRLVVSLELGDLSGGICPEDDATIGFDEPGHTSWIKEYCGTIHISHYNLYVISLYWAVTTVSTIGYGDAANPQTMAERYVWLSVVTIAALQNVLCG
jgi:potassium voltage-gated channel Eag-related subfamily H protein 7